MRQMLVTAVMLGSLMSGVAFAASSVDASADQIPVMKSGTSGIPIDINKADATHLEGLHGLAEVKAKAIVDYRSSHGPFQSIDELDNVKGIGPQFIAKLKAKNPGQLVCSGVT